MTRSRWAITPCNDYPPDWPELSEAAKLRANYTCEHCGMEFEPGTNKAVSAVNANGCARLVNSERVGILAIPPIEAVLTGGLSLWHSQKHYPTSRPLSRAPR